MLLAFATQNANSALKAAKNTRKEVSTKETLWPKILNYRLYIGLIDLLLELLDCIADWEAIIKADDEVREINNVIEFMNMSIVVPMCKQLNNTIPAEQFIATHKDEHIMNLALQAIDESVPEEYFKTEWTKNTEARKQEQDKTKMFEQLQSRYAHLLTDYKMPKETPNDHKTSPEVSFISSVSNTESKKPFRLKQTPSELTKEIINNVPIFDSKTNELNQFISTIESVTNLYQIPEVQIVSLRTRGKLHEIITHILVDVPRQDGLE